MKTVEYAQQVTLTDWGAPELLDGARMQYMVSIENGIGACLAYFSNEEDAKQFAEFKSISLSAAKKVDDFLKTNPLPQDS